MNLMKKMYDDGDDEMKYAYSNSSLIPDLESPRIFDVLISILGA